LWLNEVSRMPDSFGARLRQQRDKCGIALAAIAKQTRIKEALLEALERDDLSQWPTGFYRRAFFRAYASAIQLDPESAFREFQATYPEPPEVDVVAAMAATLGRGEGAGRSMDLRGAVESAFSSFSRFRRSTAADLSVASEPSGTSPGVRPAVEPVGHGLQEPFESEAPAGRTLDVAEPLTHPADSRPDTTIAVSEPEPTPEMESDPPPNYQAEREPSATDHASDPTPDLVELARLCAEFCCVTTTAQTEALLHQSAQLLDAAGLIVWTWNPRESHLQPALAHGYSPRVLAQLPMVRRDDDNATAVAFRTAQTRVISDSTSGECAFVIPLRTAAGCVGVFAVELARGRDATKSRIALATVLATQLTPIADCLSQPEQLELLHAVNGATL
jgi:hypothetical protein